MEGRKLPKLLEGAYDFAELLQAEEQPMEWIVDGMLPKTGAAILASPPKRRKSFMCFDLCFSVLTGRPFLGRTVTQGRAIYLALEDTRDRLIGRIKRINDGWPQIAAGVGMVRTKAPGLHQGLAIQIRELKEYWPDLALVVIDVFQKVRPPSDRTNDYQSDFNTVSSFNDLANELEMAILLVHHTRKSLDPEEVFDNISGSSGIFGAVSTAWMIEGKHGEPEATLHITGKDVEPADIEMRFNDESFRFEPADEATGFDNTDPIVKLIIREVNAHGGGWEVKSSQMPVAARNYRDLKALHSLERINLRKGGAPLRELERRGYSATQNGKNSPWYFCRKM